MSHHSEFNQEVTKSNLYSFSSTYTNTHPTSRCCKYGILGSLSQVQLITEVLFTSSQTSILVETSAVSKNFYLNWHGQSSNPYSSKNTGTLQKEQSTGNSMPPGKRLVAPIGNTHLFLLVKHTEKWIMQDQTEPW